MVCDAFMKVVATVLCKMVFASYCAHECHTVVGALSHGSCCELNAPHTQSYVCHDPCAESPRQTEASLSVSVPCQAASDGVIEKFFFWAHISSCEADGSYSPEQCCGSPGMCWCVTQTTRFDHVMSVPVLFLGNLRFRPAHSRRILVFLSIPTEHEQIRHHVGTIPFRW